MPAGEERLAENQENFRHANKRLGEIIKLAQMGDGPVAFLCECADERCLGRIDLEVAQYDEPICSRTRT